MLEDVEVIGLRSSLLALTVTVDFETSEPDGVRAQLGRGGTGAAFESATKRLLRLEPER